MPETGPDLWAPNRRRTNVEQQNEDGLWDFHCSQCQWQSVGWPNREDAAARGAQHMDEHTTRQPMPELADFNADEVI
jgi:hypothetical protein